MKRHRTNCSTSYEWETDDGGMAEFGIDGWATKGSPGCMYKRNGDPGDPPEPPEVEITEIRLKEKVDSEGKQFLFVPSDVNALVVEFDTWLQAHHTVMERIEEALLEDASEREDGAKEAAMEAKFDAMRDDPDFRRDL